MGGREPTHLRQWPAGARSSADQSIGLLIRRSKVRILPGAPVLPRSAVYLRPTTCSPVPVAPVSRVRGPSRSGSRRGLRDGTAVHEEATRAARERPWQPDIHSASGARRVRLPGESDGGAGRSRRQSVDLMGRDEVLRAGFPAPPTVSALLADSAATAAPIGGKSRLGTRDEVRGAVPALGWLRVGTRQDGIEDGTPASDHAVSASNAS